MTLQEVSIEIVTQKILKKEMQMKEGKKKYQIMNVTKL